MQLTVIQIGKTNDQLLIPAIESYQKRLKHYIHVDWLTIVPKKKLQQAEQIKEEEGKLLLAQLKTSDYLLLLDEKGKEYSSKEWAGFLQRKMNTGLKNLVLVIGGAYGFSAEVYQRANEKVALSQMTFTHQMVRLFLAEQLYRGMTILKGEKYHH